MLLFVYSCKTCAGFKTIDCVFSAIVIPENVTLVVFHYFLWHFLAKLKPSAERSSCTGTEDSFTCSKTEYCHSKHVIVIIKYVKYFLREENSLWYCEQKNTYCTTLTQYAQSMKNNTISKKDKHHVQDITQLS